MGGNTYNRRYLSNEELLPLVKMVIQYPLKSIFLDKVFETEKKWRANVARFLDNDSSNRFYFLLETFYQQRYCKFCKQELTILSFHYTKKGGFNIFCPDCFKNEVWKTSEYLGNDTLIARGKLISKQKLKFYQTDYGKDIAKQIGIKNSIALTEFFKTDQGTINKEKSRIYNKKLMNEKILSGKFTPNSNNRNTHWDSTYDNKKYRSSWEALYQYFYPDDEHETLRILYQYNGKELIYIVDFINYNNKIVTEVKPQELCKDEKFIAKFNALQEWANTNGFTARIANLEFLKMHGIPTNLHKFDNKTQQKIYKIYEKT